MDLKSHFGADYFLLECASDQRAGITTLVAYSDASDASGGKGKRALTSQLKLLIFPLVSFAFFEYSVYLINCLVLDAARRWR